jgi:glucose-specific phosphotransferase system IIA component
MASEFPLMLFGLPAAAFAMYLRAEKSKRKAVGGIMLTAALTSIITGITEPIEFAFIFVAPLLYVVHVGSAFMSGLMTNAFDIHLGYTFSASLIDYGLGFFNQKNSLLLFTVVGPITAAWYFSVFYFTIGFFDFKTPGREKSLDGGLENKPSITERSKEILAALGGKENIIELDACITRLRLTVKDGAQVDKLRLKELGAAGTLDAGKGNFQIIFGVESDHIKEDLKTLMSTARLIEAIDKNEATLRAVTSGRMLGISDVPDETFAEKILGDGYAIDPTEGKIQAPVDGTIMTVFRTNHAIGMQSTTGQEILIHVGVDTVKMDGRGFKTLVIAGQKVKAGDPLLEFDLELVRREAKSSITPVVITNLDQSGRLRALKTGNVLAGDNVMEIENPN